MRQRAGPRWMFVERDGLTCQNAAKVDAENKVLSVRQQGEALKEKAKVKAEVRVFENTRKADNAASMTDLAMKWKAGTGWPRSPRLRPPRLSASAMPSSRWRLR